MLGIKRYSRVKYLGINRDLEKGKYIPKSEIFIQINKSMFKLTDLFPLLVNLETMHLKYSSMQMRKHGALWQIQLLLVLLKGKSIKETKYNVLHIILHKPTSMYND